ncbi:hypothetical protein Tco_0929517 [Tanacetum coccineum]
MRDRVSVCILRGYDNGDMLMAVSKEIFLECIMNSGGSYHMMPMRDFLFDFKEFNGVITEYLVNISKRRTFWSLNEDILKITILTTNTPYPLRKIRRIRACTYQRPRRKLDQYAVSSKDQYAVLEI